ncbi:grasp-with-spasm system ATP-grasp peptide maturase [uncultured Chryseobacterium sp.]|uniref:grasp-with-spasm system ATP-grasp peptide maturase n=1 Tax=uncultured Chryseobacterium sp. TaxID=259322 RepID=UPI0025F0F4FF|nr:grasp-with-spasm system ATP-grasp peptide maturase [uncultured Chryseobacterium sp.]
MIVIFSIRFDHSTNAVVEILKNLGEKVVRINGDDDIYKFDSLNDKGIYFINTITQEIVNLLDAKACWWRRTGLRYNNFISHPITGNSSKDEIDLFQFTNQKSQYLKDEYLALKDYIFKKVYDNCEINLGTSTYNLNRLIVLDIATKYGLKTPNFEVITTEKQIQDSLISLGKVVTKAISNGIYDYIENNRFYTYTELLEEEFYTQSNYILFPSLISSLVNKSLEIRSFYIDGHFYSMAIFSQSNEKTRIDFRKYSNNRNEPYKLPFNIEEKLKKIFIELNLNCGSADLILDENGEYVFLEINPVGQYGMTSEPCNYGLDIIIANYLRYGNVIENN